MVMGMHSREFKNLEYACNIRANSYVSYFINYFYVFRNIFFNIYSKIKKQN